MANIAWLKTYHYSEQYPSFFTVEDNRKIRSNQLNQHTTSEKIDF